MFNIFSSACSLPATNFSLRLFAEIEKVQKDEGKEEEKFIDVVINKNMKLGQKVLIPVKQFPKVSAVVPPPETSPKMWCAQIENFRLCYL